MPVTPTYPGVYIEEIPSGVRTITGVATSITAFVGRALRGPTDEPVTINGFGDFERIFGGLWVESTLGYTVRDFYLNGGSQAIIVRLFNADDDEDTAERSPIDVDALDLEAKYPGSWGQYLRANLDADVSPSVAAAMGLDPADLFNLRIVDTTPGGRSELFRNVTLEDHSRRVDRILASESRLVRWRGTFPATPPEMAGLAALATAQDALADAEQALADALEADPNADVTEEEAAVEAARTALAAAWANVDDPVLRAEKALAAVKLADPLGDHTAEETALQTALDAVQASDGVPLDQNSFIGPGKEGSKEGLFALTNADLFNMLCIPPYTGDNVDPALIAAAGAFCEARRAMLLLDPPSNWLDKDMAKAQVGNLGTASKNAALFFPRLRQPDPLRDNQKGDFVPCGAVAGVFARTDTQRGVWKAPAGLEAILVGVPELSVPLTDAENGELNPLGINCLRTMPAVGRVIWGARTRQGDDRLASEWKYIPVRRTALFIEESLYRGLQWVVFEPNDEPLWAQIRLNVGAFMHNLFRQGAFQGKSPRDAYFVKCDSETTTQTDINLGIVNIIVGFAPLKPAEFVIVKIQQMAGQIQA